MGDGRGSNSKGSIFMSIVRVEDGFSDMVIKKSDGLSKRPVLRTYSLWSELEACGRDD